METPPDKPGSGRPGVWLTDWFPQDGDRLRAKIKPKDWMRLNDNRVLNCGEFILDAPGGSFFPCGISLDGVSEPADEGFTGTQRSQVWENATIQKIASDMAGRAGLVLSYDAGNVPVKVKEQQNAPDANFLRGLCDDYGLCMKVYEKKLVIYDREQYKQRPAPPNLHFGPTDIRISFRKMKKGTYTGGRLVYTDSRQEEKVEFKVGGGKRVLTINRKADDRADAERLIRAAVNKANHGATTVNFSMMGNPDVCAALCFEITGFGKLDGKYFVDSVTHSVADGGGYTTSGTASRVETGL